MNMVELENYVSQMEAHADQQLAGLVEAMVSAEGEPGFPTNLESKINDLAQKEIEDGPTTLVASMADVGFSIALRHAVTQIQDRQIDKALDSRKFKRDLGHGAD